jgi:formylglycine-generating enzyme required for sulfatase activity
VKLLEKNRLDIYFDADAPIQIQAKLIPTTESPDRMVFVPGGDYALVSYAKPTGNTVRLDDYFIDQFEVTNSDYLEFVTAGGYLKLQFWKYPFRKDGMNISWEQATQYFVDRTGLSGPRSWSNQSFPPGKGQHPVTGITWYEAAAYAEFRGKRLPTVFQWEKAARNGSFTHLHRLIMPWGMSSTSDRLINRANFLGHETVPVESCESGMSPYGCYNMAGNVAEWCLNPQGPGFTIAGGSWKDPLYLFSEFGAYPSFHSSDTTGFRCVINFAQQSGDQGAMTLTPEEEIPVYSSTTPAEAQAMLRHYEYDRTPLEPEIVDTQQTDAWQREMLSFKGAGGERAIAYLYLPKNAQRPLQVIHYIPTDAAFYGLPVSDEIETHAAPYIKAGRAVFAVVLKGYRKRDWPSGFQVPKRDSVAYRDMVVNWAIDHYRGLDYLTTRTEIDAGKIACFAVSVNNRKLTLVSTERRYAALILMGAGLIKSWSEMIKEADGVNFAPHMLAPKLVIHGRYDEAIPYRTEAEPLFKLLRGPKRLVVVDYGHVPPLEVSVPIINRWLDETMGTVKR